jgi:reverse gyrase
MLTEYEVNRLKKGINKFCIRCKRYALPYSLVRQSCSKCGGIFASDNLCKVKCQKCIAKKHREPTQKNTLWYILNHRPVFASEWKNIGFKKEESFKVAIYRLRKQGKNIKTEKMVRYSLVERN